MSKLAFTLDVRESAKRRIVLSLEVDRATLVPQAGPADSSGPHPSGAPTRGADSAGVGIGIGSGRVGDGRVGDGGADADTFEFFLPVWTPGSYLVREYARHLGPVRAKVAGSNQSLPCRKTSKNRFAVVCPPDVARIRLEYSVYAHELSVRTSDLTADHAYWNHACVLLWPVGQYERESTLQILKPAEWQLSTSLTIEGQDAASVTLLASDLDELIDSPCLCGRFTRHELVVRDVPHAIVLDGLGPISPPKSFLDDVTKIIEAAADVFGGTLPYESYEFQCLFTDRGHGGLEHRASTTLLASRAAMIPGKAYKDFLGLVAHELFHAWNVKRMRPQELWRYDYESENYTPMLWLAEGWTAYYDDLLCRRIKALSTDEYLAIVARNLTNLWNGMGRHVQSLGEASFDAWIRLYRPDENTRNSTQNYYGNGAVAAMVLDLTIRRATAGDRCLDDALQALYRETFSADRGYTRVDVERALTAAADQDMAPLLRKLVDGPLDPEVATLLASFGVEIVHRDRDRPFLGLSFEAGKTVIHSVTDGSPAWHAGLAPGDELLAIEGLRTTGKTWSDIIQSLAKPEAPLRLLVSTRGVVVDRMITPTNAPVGTVSLRPVQDVPSSVETLRTGWLHRD